MAVFRRIRGINTVISQFWNLEQSFSVGRYTPRVESDGVRYVVLDAAEFFQEIDQLQERGIDAERRVWVSNRAHLLLSYHKLLDKAKEGERGARAIVLTGAGRAFCAGGDLREMQEIAKQDGRVEAFFDEPLRLLNEGILLIRKTPVPFIAAVNGVASGGGCNLALACDLVIAAESAKFNQAFIKIGLTPDCGATFILPRLVGWKRATELLFTGGLIGAKEAAEMGMINSAVPDDELMNKVMGMAERLAQAPTAATGKVAQRMLEDSNVNTIVEMTSMIEVTRNYQAIQRFLDAEHERQRRAISSITANT